MSRDVLMTSGCLPEPQNYFALVVTDHLHLVSLLYVRLRHYSQLSYQSRTWDLFSGFFFLLHPVCHSQMPVSDSSHPKYLSYVPFLSIPTTLALVHVSALNYCHVPSPSPRSLSTYTYATPN